MKIDSVVVKTVIEVNGVEYNRHESDWTNSILEAQKDGEPFLDALQICRYVEES